MERPIVLLAEDSPVIALDLRWHLESMNLEVIDVPEFDRLAELCLEKRPKGLIINALGPKGQNGWILGKHLHAKWNIPVLFVTGAEEPTSRFWKQHPFPVLRKPFSRIQLKSQLKQWFAESGLLLP